MLELAILVVALVFAAAVVGVVGEHIARQLGVLAEVLSRPIDERAPRKSEGQLYGRDPEGRARR